MAGLKATPVRLGARGLPSSKWWSDLIISIQHKAFSQPSLVTHEMFHY